MQQFLDYHLLHLFFIISTKTQFLGQAKINSTSQLISGIFTLLQKLLKYFSGITTLVSFLPTLFASYLGLSASLPSPFVIFSSILQVFPVILVLYLNDSESEERRLLGSSL